MNKLIIIGNGFDLANGLKTDYNSFIKWFVRKCFREAIGSCRNIYDHILRVTCVHSEEEESYINGEDLLEFFFQGGFDDKPHGIAVHFPHLICKIKVAVTSTLLKGLLNDSREYDWVDIENHFYHRLKEILGKKKPFMAGPHGILSPKERIDLLVKLNQELDELKQQLSEYLAEISRDAVINDAFTPFVEEGINPRMISEKHLLKNEDYDAGSGTRSLIKPNLIQFLNFNYTSLIEKLPISDVNIDYISIHGALHDERNPIIFGYGDEIDDAYHEMEKTNINAYLKHIKSFGYFQTNNYSRLVNAMASEPFVVYIWGHSCGLSDRTLLNMIFEHDHCAGIKIFYHKKADGSDNFQELTQNISRHFRNKVKMRNRVFNKGYCEVMPQV